MEKQELEIITVCWGELYFKKFTKYAAPSVLAEANRLKIKRHFSVKWVIYTDEETSVKISSYFKTKDATDFSPQLIVLNEDEKKGNASLELLAGRHLRKGVALLALNADFLVSDCLGGLLNTVASKGYSAIRTFGVRVSENELIDKYDTDIKAGNFGSRSVSRYARECMLPIYRGHTIGARPANCKPGRIVFKNSKDRMTFFEVPHYIMYICPQIEVTEKFELIFSSYEQQMAVLGDVGVVYSVQDSHEFLYLDIHDKDYRYGLLKNQKNTLWFTAKFMDKVGWDVILRMLRQPYSLLTNGSTGLSCCTDYLIGRLVILIVYALNFWHYTILRRKRPPYPVM